ncbi:MAG: Spy/CpxP family protein refolding chaperone [Gammaproteobacteria bacterium]|nr:Spy/CpxP family protein refolding chaperone [Gammaproteobacteria bacterium]MDH5802230.1 Spy/CpxP family protein refolding chaperone [Gammaproteobacteria bacterium]
MSIMTKMVGATALGLTIAVAIPVLGHGGAGMRGTQGGGDYDHGPGHMGMNFGQMHGGAMHPGQMHFGANTDEALGTLKDSLKLSEEQQPAWNQFEQAVKSMFDNHPQWGSENGEVESHFAQMEQHFANMKTVFESRKALYETLTDQQKETINKTLPGPFGHHYGKNG